MNNCYYNLIFHGNQLKTAWSFNNQIINANYIDLCFQIKTVPLSGGLSILLKIFIRIYRFKKPIFPTLNVI